LRSKGRVPRRSHLAKAGGCRPQASGG
jgi:hypothetical protein